MYIIKDRKNGILTRWGFNEIDDFSIKEALLFSERQADGIIKAFGDCTDIEVYKEEVK
jgi:hypothetical protein